MVNTEGSTQTFRDQCNIVTVIEVAVTVKDSHLSISFTNGDLLEEANADVQLRREFPDTFLRRNFGDFAAFYQVILQTTVG